MQILLYHKHLSAQQEGDILDRAAHRRHLLQKTRIWDIGTFLAAAVWGPLMHTSVLQQIPLLQWLVPVNESVWEHGKLLFYPLLLAAILRRLVTGKLQHGILTTFAEGILLGIFTMISGFYLYSGILGIHTLTADIALYYLSLTISVLWIRSHAGRQKKSSLPGLLILLLLTGCFIYFTYIPPRIGLFHDLSQPVQSLQLLPMHPWEDPLQLHSFLPAFL